MRMGGKVPESHVLVDKIVKLQKTLARKQEKIEFMEEHVSTMLEEMKKKNKLIQNYILKVESGALVSSQMDENKVSEKIQKVRFFNNWSLNFCKTCKICINISHKIWVES